MSNETEETEAPRQSNMKPDDAEFFGRVFAAGTTDGATGGAPATSQEIAQFEVPHEMCGKHLKASGEDFMLQIQSLTPGQEKAITRNVESGVQMFMGFAEASLLAVNGAPLKKHHKEWLWNHLGTGGRSLVVAMYTEAFAADPKALTSSRESLSQDL